EGRVPAWPDRGYHADSAVHPDRVITRVLQRRVGDLKEKPDLWVHRRRVPRGELKESGVEVLDVVDQWGRPDVLLVCEPRRTHPAREQRGLIEPGDRFQAQREVLPESLDVAGARYPCRHPDHGDGTGIPFSVREAGPTTVRHEHSLETPLDFVWDRPRLHSTEPNSGL